MVPTSAPRHRRAWIGLVSGPPPLFGGRRVSEGIEAVPQLQRFDFEGHFADGSCLLRELSSKGSDLSNRAFQRCDFSKDERLSGAVECVDIFHQNRARIRAIRCLVPNHARDAASNVDPMPTRGSRGHRMINTDLQYRFIQGCDDIGDD